MAKVKNKGSSNAKADDLSKKKGQHQKKVLNPFEVHINKEKLKVLGKKLKNDRGLPGISRARALSKRKHTLLPEYMMQNKTNTFLDRRIGEKNSNLSTEDKFMARYTAVRVKQHSKKSIFNLADDEVLTHKGQTLSEIEKFDDPISDDDNDDEMESSGKLGKQFVQDAHFGGGILKRTEGGYKSHKDLIDQLIADSKRRKHEMQKQKEATLELTEKLDAEWKDLIPLVTKKTKEDEEALKNSVDDYDKAMRELRFEARGVPSDKLKTEDEIAKEAKEKLERLERERLERMNGNLEPTKTIKHRSADDLEDNFVIENDYDIPDTTLSYNNQGESNVHLNVNVSKETNEPDTVMSNEESEEERTEDELESEDETDDDLSDLKESDDCSSDNEISESELKASEEENINVEEEYRAKQKSEVLKPKIIAEQTDEIELLMKSKQKAKLEPKTKVRDSKSKTEPKINVELETKIEELSSEANSETPVEDLSQKIKEDLLKRKEIMEKARNELPYTFGLPNDYAALQNTLQNHSPAHQGIIIERMIKCNHPSLKEGNKDGLDMLFVYLMQYLNDISTDISSQESLKSCFAIFSNLSPHIFDLAQMNPENACYSLFEVIKEKQFEFRGRNKNFPGLDVLIFLKLVSILCSTSDFKHLVVTPCFFFITQMMTTCKVKSRRDVAYGLFIICLFLEYTTLSKRFVPQMVIFLNGIIHMAIPKKPIQLLKVLPPFKALNSALVISAPTNDFSNKLEISDLILENFDNNFKHRALQVSVSLLKKLYNNYQQLPSCFEVFELTFKYLKLIPQDHLNSTLKNEINSFVGSLEEMKANRRLQYIVMEAQKPKALRLYEPNIQRIFDGKMHRVQSKEKAETDKLLHKLKKETKGALREIRRDKAFLGRVKIDQRLQSDAERNEKVKRIYAEASVQQSELNAIDRSNKRQKKK